VSRVDGFTDVGRRMVLEGMRRLSLDGLTVGLADPEGKLPDPDLGDGTYPFDATGSAPV
ncbi:glutaminase A, partial [Geobacillus sp. MMMUD3]|nr:glutaminase A [Geobacillus sp. MMMUD3]